MHLFKCGVRGERLCWKLVSAFSVYGSSYEVFEAHPKCFKYGYRAAVSTDPNRDETHYELIW